MILDLDAYLRNRWDRLDAHAKTILHLSNNRAFYEFTKALWTGQYYEAQLEQLGRKEDKPMVRIVIEVKGGCVQAVAASETVEVLVDDHDAAELGPTCLDVNVTYVENVFAKYEDTHNTAESDDGNNPVLS